MGKCQHLIKYVCELLEKRAFLEEDHCAVPKARTNRVIVREGQLMMANFTKGTTAVRTEWDLVKRWREAAVDDVKNFSSSGGGGGDGDAEVSANDAPIVVYMLALDDHEHVTVAKQRERASRRDGKAPLSDAECDAFCAEARYADGKLDEAALAAAVFGDEARLSATDSDAARAARRRMNELVTVAVMSAPYGQEVLVLVARNGVLEMTFGGANAFVDDDGAYQAPMRLKYPRGVAEAEYLCVHMALRAAFLPVNFMFAVGDDVEVSSPEIVAQYPDVTRKTAVMLHCSDTDVFGAALLNTLRVVAPYMSTPDAAPMIIVNMAPRGQKSAASKDYPYKFDAFKLCVELASLPPSDAVGLEFVAESLVFLAMLGGSDKVEQLPLCSAEAVFRAYTDTKSARYNADEVRQPLHKRRFVHCERVDLDAPQLDRLKQRLRVRVDEDAVADFLVRAYSTKYTKPVVSHVAQLMNSEKVVSDELLERALTYMRDETESKYAADMTAYPAKKVEQEKKIAVKEAEIAALPSPEKTKKRKDRSYPKLPPAPVRKFAPPATAAELRATVRRAVWQLAEVLNAVVEDGIPDAAARDGAVWGWRADGELHHPVLPAEEAQLFA